MDLTDAKRQNEAGVITERGRSRAAPRIFRSIKHFESLISPPEW